MRSELSEETTKKYQKRWMVTMKDASVAYCIFFIQMEDIP